MFAAANFASLSDIWQHVFHIFTYIYTYDIHMYAAGLVESLYGNVIVYVRVYIFSCFVAHLEIADSSSCFTMIFV